MGASFSGKKAVATHLPLSALTSDAFTDELPTSNPNKSLFAIIWNNLSINDILYVQISSFFSIFPTILSKNAIFLPNFVFN
jgi:hypothetical protein